MGWYATPGVVWRRRVAITVPIVGAGPVDVNVTIPPELDEFWNNIDASGVELRVVWYDSQTLLSYAVDNGSGGAFVAANRVGRVQIDGMTIPAATGALLIWLYFDPDVTQASAASAVTIGSPLTGAIESGAPGQHRLAHQSAPARSTKPRTIVHKTVNEQAFIWIRYDEALGKRVTGGNKSRVHEEPLYATISVVNAAAADQATMYDTDQLRWVWSRGQMWLRIRVKAGTTATRYTAVVLTRTILPGATTATQQLETRVGIDVGDSLES